MHWVPLGSFIPDCNCIGKVHKMVLKSPSNIASMLDMNLSFYLLWHFLVITCFMGDLTWKKSS